MNKQTFIFLFQFFSLVISQFFNPLKHGNSNVEGIDGTVNVVVENGTTLYIGGLFNSAGKVADTRNFALYNGTHFKSLGTVCTGPSTTPLPQIFSMRMFQNSLFIGGFFIRCGTTTLNLNGIAKFDGSNFISITNQTVNAIEILFDNSQSNLLFITKTQAWRFNGTYVSNLFDAPTIGNPILCATLVGNIIWMGGGFSNFQSISYLFGWDLVANNYTTTANWPTTSVVAITPFRNGFIAAGGFISLAPLGEGTQYFVYYDVSGAKPWNGVPMLNHGLTRVDKISKLSTSGDDIYISGYLYGAPSASVAGFGKFTYQVTNSFQRISTTNDPVQCFTNTSNFGLVLGGSFTSTNDARTCSSSIASSSPTIQQAYLSSNFASLGQQWTPFLLNSIYYLINDIKVHPVSKRIYVGGSFKSTNTDLSRYISYFDGTNWNAVSPAFTNSPINSILLNGSEFWMSGSFYSLGPLSPTYGLAHWDNEAGAWDVPLPSLPICGNAISIFLFGNDMYLSGDTSCICRFNGTGWKLIPNVAVNGVRAWTSFQGKLYAGSTSTSSGSALLVLNTTSDSFEAILGATQAVNGGITAFAVNGSDLWIGGSFGAAGQVPTNGLAIRSNGTVWVTPRNQPNELTQVLALAIHSSKRYMFVGSSMALYRYDGINQTWISFTGTGLVTILTWLENDILVVGGSFSHLGGVCGNGLLLHYVFGNAPTPAPTPLIISNTIDQENNNNNNNNGNIDSANTNLAAIVGGVLAGVVLLLIIVAIIFFVLWRKRSSNSNQTSRNDVDLVEKQQAISTKKMLDMFVSAFGREFILKREDVEKSQSIGSGQFGTVYFGTWASQPVALKTLTNKQENLESFIEEIKLAKQLHSPAVVNTFGAVEIEGAMYVVMEFCEKGNLLSWLKSPEGSASDHLTLARIALETTRALVILEKRSIIHRDIAARNFLLTRDMSVKLSDFGLARATLKNELYNAKSEVMIPIRWAAPEIVLRSQYSSASDRYALGVTLWEIFSKGGTPYMGLTNNEICKKWESKSMEPLRTTGNAVSDELISKLCSFKPEDRPSLESVQKQFAALLPDLTINFTMQSTQTNNHHYDNLTQGNGSSTMEHQYENVQSRN